MKAADNRLGWDANAGFFCQATVVFLFGGIKALFKYVTFQHRMRAMAIGIGRGVTAELFSET